MKRIFLLALSFLLSAISLKAQYSDIQGTTADSFRIGNDRYVIFKTDNDSNFVQVNVNGEQKRIAFVDMLSKARLDSTRHAWNLMGGSAFKIPYQYAKDSTRFISAPSTNKKVLYFQDSLFWKSIWEPDTNTIVRTTRTLTAIAPLRIDNIGTANLSANRTFSLLYNATQFTLSTNYLTANNITAISTNGMSITTPFTLGSSVTINTPQDIRTTASPTFNNTYWTGDVSSQSYTSQSNGWKVTNSGAADFRYLYVDEMHAKSFIADLEQALAGGQIISKSVAKVAVDFTATSSGTFTVESFAGYPNVDVFQSGDYIRFRIFSRANGSLTIANVWASVSGTASYSDGGKKQTWNYSLLSGSGNIIYAGSLALDYGTSSNDWGIIEQTTVDGQWGANSPYWQVLTGNPTSAQTVQTRLGKISGITDAYFGMLNGYGLYSANAYLKGSIYMNSGTITWSGVNKPTQNDLGTWTTYIDANGIYTGTLTANQLRFYAVGRDSVVAKINASNEGITINTAKLNLTGTLQVGGAAADINGHTTTITGDKVRSGLIQSNNFDSQEGAQIDLTNATMTFGGDYNPLFTVDNYGNINAQGGTISSWTFNGDYFYEGTNISTTKIAMSGANKSIYARPFGTGSNTKFVNLGQTYNGTAFTGYYGISAIDGNNNYIFRLDDYTRSIAGWNFDYQKFYNISGTTGYELSNATTKTVTTGFAVWNPSAPKMFIGNSTNYVDWNNITSNTLTIKGQIVSSWISTASAQTGNYTYAALYDAVVRSQLYTDASNYKDTRLQNGLFQSQSVVSGASQTINFNIGNGFYGVNINGAYAMRWRGRLSADPSSDNREGDMYANTSLSIVRFYSGGAWQNIFY